MAVITGKKYFTALMRSSDNLFYLFYLLVLTVDTHLLQKR